MRGKGAAVWLITCWILLYPINGWFFFIPSCNNMHFCESFYPFSPGCLYSLCFLVCGFDLLMLCTCKSDLFFCIFGWGAVVFFSLLMFLSKVILGCHGWLARSTQFDSPRFWINAGNFGFRDILHWHFGFFYIKKKTPHLPVTVL